MTRRDEFTAAVHQRPVIAAARTMDDVREAAASRVAPFLLIPLRTYADQFAPAQPEEAEEA